MRNRSRELYTKACTLIPRGVNSPVRAFKSVGLDPLYIDHGQGSKIYDVDGNEYIDYVGSFGPLILGHAHPEIIDTIKIAAEKGLSFGACHENEIIFASMICDAFSSIDKVRLVNSGTEAVMSAIRLARGFTGKDLIIKFDGCYHGHADSMLVAAGSGVATFGIPGTPGIPKSHAQSTIIVSYNNINEIKKVMSEHKNKIACVIVEPVCGNMGVVLPKEGFLQELRLITKENNIILIFDEVITGFRLEYGGASTYFNISPDIICLGKIIGGGMPIGAFGGKQKIMDCIAPEGNIYQAGTLSGNPIAVAVGIKTLELLQKKDYRALEKKTIYLTSEITKEAQAKNIPLTINAIASLFTIFYTNCEVYDYKTAKESNTGEFKKTFKELLDSGIFIPASQFEASFLSFVHTKEDIDRTIEAYKKVLNKE